MMGRQGAQRFGGLRIKQPKLAAVQRICAYAPKLSELIWLHTGGFRITASDASEASRGLDADAAHRLWDTQRTGCLRMAQLKFMQV
jgi:hypothetical protein